MPRPAHLLTSGEVTQEIPVTTMTLVGKSWPYETFMTHLRALMDRENIADFAELSRLTGVSQTQFSNYRSGVSQPSQESLDKIAPVLHTTETALYIAAGRLKPGHLDAPSEFDMVVLPREILDLVKLYQDAPTEEARRIIRDQVAFAVRGLAIVTADDQVRPRSHRRRSA
jgi:transcriptional regulator with XRE-family HTH domain